MSKMKAEKKYEAPRIVALEVKEELTAEAGGCKLCQCKNECKKGKCLALCLCPR